MIYSLIILLPIALIISAIPILGANQLNARGIFIAYLIVGALMPSAEFFITGNQYSNFFLTFSNSTVIVAILITILFAIIALYFSRIFEHNQSFRPINFYYKSNDSVSIKFAAISIIASILYISSMSYQFGGIENFLVRMYQRTVVADSVVNYLSMFMFCSYIFSIFSFSFCKGSEFSYAKSLSFLSIALASLVALSSGGRSMAILYIFALLYPYLARMRIDKLVLSICLFFLISAVVSYIMLDLRVFYQGSSIEERGYAQGFYSSASVGLIFLDAIAASVEYAGAVGHDFGKVYLNLLAQPIPRELWAGKPIQLSIELRHFFFGDSTGGTPATLIGESYIAFGLLGPFLAAIVYAWILARINRVCSVAVRTDCRLRFAVAGIFIPLVGFVLVRSGFDTGLSRLLIPAFWCVVAAWIARPARAATAQRIPQFRPPPPLPKRRNFIRTS